MDKEGLNEQQEKSPDQKSKDGDEEEGSQENDDEKASEPESIQIKESRDRIEKRARNSKYLNGMRSVFKVACLFLIQTK